MARHRRDDQQLGRVLRAFMLEMLELAKGLARLDRLRHPHRLAVHHRFVEVEARLAARRGGVGDHLERRGEKRAGTEITEWIGAVLQYMRPRGGNSAGPPAP